MKRFSTAILGGVAVLALTGTALAAGRSGHSLDVTMPDGMVAHIQYRGDVPPDVTVLPPRIPAGPIGVFEPFDAAPFAMLDHIAAQMARETEMIERAAASVPTKAGADGTMDFARFSKLPAGTMHYSVVSTSTGSGTCSRSIEVTSTGSGSPPKVLSNSWGTCAAESGSNTKSGRVSSPTSTAATPSTARPAAVAMQPGLITA